MRTISARLFFKGQQRRNIGIWEKTHLQWNFQLKGIRKRTVIGSSETLKFQRQLMGFSVGWAFIHPPHQYIIYTLIIHLSSIHSSSIHHPSHISSIIHLPPILSSFHPPFSHFSFLPFVFPSFLTFFFCFLPSFHLSFHPLFLTHTSLPSIFLSIHFKNFMWGSGSDLVIEHMPSMG